MSIGEKLKTARKEKKLTLEEVSAQTKIRPEILKRLEENRFSEVLNPTYVKGFLRKYAVLLKLDPEEIVEEYLRFSPPESRPLLRLPSLSFPADSRSWVFPAVVVLLVVLVAVLTYHLRSPRWLAPETPVAAPEETNGRAEKDSRAVSTVTEKSRVSPVSGALELEATAKGDCWIRARADDRVIFQEILRAGEKAVWRAEKEFALHVGKGENLELKLNGKALGSPGKGVIKHIVITREGMNAGR